MYYKTLTIEITSPELPTKAKITIVPLDGDRVKRNKHFATLYGRKTVMNYPDTWTDDKAVTEAIRQIITKLTEDIHDMLKLQMLYMDLIPAAQDKG